MSIQKMIEELQRIAVDFPDAKAYDSENNEIIAVKQDSDGDVWFAS